MAKQTSESFGDLLRRHRLAAGLSQEELAERAKMSQRGVSDLERGARTRPRRETIRLLARALDLSLADAEHFTCVARGRAARPSSSALPLQRTPLIGRERELEWVAQLVKDPNRRLVTLTGAGGVGKTRLAIAVAQRIAREGDAPVVFVPLVSLSAPNQVLASAAYLMHVDVGTRTPFDALATAIGNDPMLLVLDNFEHVLPAATQVAQVLERCSRLTLLITSRIALHVHGEHQIEVLPLALPGPNARIGVDTLAVSPAVALFLERASAQRPDLELTNASAATIVEICRRLEGLPLALELAAARMRVLSASELLERLDVQLAVLAAGPVDLPPRQQTMRATIDWSHRLLTEPEQSLLSRLSVFRGGWTLKAAESVCAKGLGMDVLEGMTALVDASLVLRIHGEDGPSRFTMLETVREYAEEKLLEGEGVTPVRQAHARYYLRLAERAEAELRGRNQIEWARRVDTEFPNIHAAVRHLLDSGEVEAEFGLVSTLFDYWAPRVHRDEARRWLDEGLQQQGASVSPQVRGKALWARGATADNSRDDRPDTAFVQAALPLLRGSSDRLITGRTLVAAGQVAQDRGDDEEAIAHYRAALEVFREIGDQRGIAVALGNIGTDLLLHAKDYASATQHYEEALSVARAAGDIATLADCVHLLGHIAHEVGDDELAARRFEEAVSAFRDLGATKMIALLLYDLGTLFLARGELKEAGSYLEECVLLFQDVGQPMAVACSIGSLGAVSLKKGEYDLAKQHMNRALRLLREHENDAFLVAVLGYMASLALAMHDAERAGRLLGARAQLHAQLTLPVHWPVNVWPTDHEPTIQRARKILGEERWCALQAEGAAMSREDVILYALQEETSTCPAGHSTRGS